MTTEPQEIRLPVDADLTDMSYRQAEELLLGKSDEPLILLVHPERVREGREFIRGRVEVRPTKLFTSVDSWVLIGKNYVVYSEGA